MSSQPKLYLFDGICERLFKCNSYHAYMNSESYLNYLARGEKVSEDEVLEAIRFGMTAKVTPMTGLRLRTARLVIMSLELAATVEADPVEDTTCQLFDTAYDNMSKPMRYIFLAFMCGYYIGHEDQFLPCHIKAVNKFIKSESERFQLDKLS